ncbi:cyclic nucleotide-gated cation channel subunit A isoform X2 [Condylostylus longicornis]|uniref:cyclic nucleotide-gated cation channel subunit A isoform X2 n=1 Tax=Condylostylus longicornis TaxID=2530218 RepID=UPI00244E1AAC|nr:cyclic nucleotide-gated cation channel subunit A isoform X2 [Condylostylus longicornis]
MQSTINKMSFCVQRLPDNNNSNQKKNYQYIHQIKSNSGIYYKSKRYDFNIGDIVLIEDEFIPPTKWLLGRIDEIHSTDDDNNKNKIKFVSLHTKNGTIQRDINKLLLLYSPRITGRPLYRTRINNTGCTSYQYPYGNYQMYQANYGLGHPRKRTFTSSLSTTPGGGTSATSVFNSDSTETQDDDSSIDLFEPLPSTNPTHDDRDIIAKKSILTNHISAITRIENKNDNEQKKLGTSNKTTTTTATVTGVTTKTTSSLIKTTGLKPVSKITDGVLSNSITNRITSVDDDDDNTIESGIRTSNAARKREISLFRRTINILRFRLPKGRTKPPDWLMNQVSGTEPTIPNDKTNEEAHEEQLTAAARLCNRLSVDPSLPSHYRWLAVVSLAVLYNIIFVVGRAIFWEINRRAPPLWWFLDYLCDFIYLVDTLVHMHEGYLDQGLLVRDAYKLRKNYFTQIRTWIIDLISMFPTDLTYFWWDPSSCSSRSLPCPVIVRLNRLFRLPRMWEWFDRTETATGYPNAFRICKVVLAILVLIHWNACLYFAISYALGFGIDNWVYNLNGDRNATLQRQYIYSFYWSTLTLTTIGETPTPENDAEYLFVVADFLAGVLIFATIVGNIGSMISNMNVARVEFQNRMDGVKQYMAFRRVGSELEARVIRWFAYTWSQSGALDEERVLSALPDKLKAEIAIRVHMDTLKQVRIFQDCEPGLLEALVLKLKLQVFSPGDYICRKGDVGKEMYIVKRGKLSVVADDGTTVFATLGAGSVFGEVSVLEIAGNRTGNRRTANVRSLGYSDLFCLAKRDLWETLADYPEARALLIERGCQLLRKDGLLDEEIFANSQRQHDSIEVEIGKLEQHVDNLTTRLARLIAEYAASQAKLKQRIATLELNADAPKNREENEKYQRTKSGRLYSLQTRKRRSRPSSAGGYSTDSKKNTL